MAAARDRLGEFGITLTEKAGSTGPEAPSGSEPVVVLSRGHSKAAYSVRPTEPMTLTALAQAKPAGAHPLLVIGHRVNRRSAQALREANIQFIDALGNAYLTFGDVLVDVRGRTDLDDREPGYPSKGGVRQSTNLFSRVRAQVIMVLLSWPELVGGRHREIAYAAGTSLGQAHDVVTKLEEAGFLVPSTQGLRRYDELLDLWTAAYPTGLGARLEVSRFHGDPSRPLKTEGPVYLSGEAAAGVDIARPATLTMYLDSLDPRLAVANRWSKRPDQVSNIFIRRKFWISPRLEEEDPLRKHQNAPWPLVYADLLATGDARLAEVARTWRAGRARPHQG